MVVLAPDPGGVGEQGQEVGPAVGRRRQCGRVVGPRGRRGRPGGPGAGRRGGRRRPARRPGRRPGPRRRGRRGSAGGRPGPRRRAGAVTVPMTVARTSQRRQTSSTAGPVGRGDDGQHALLALAGEDLEGLHPRLPPGDGPDIDVHAHAGPGRRLRWWRRPDRRRRGPGSPPPAPRRAAPGRPRSGASPRRGHPPGRSGAWRRRRPAPSRRSRPRPARSPRRSRHARWSSRGGRPGSPAPGPRPSTSRSTGSAPRQSTFTSGFWA